MSVKQGIFLKLLRYLTQLITLFVSYNDTTHMHEQNLYNVID
jgi:hypothetical protein